MPWGRGEGKGSDRHHKAKQRSKEEDEASQSNTVWFWVNYIEAVGRHGKPRWVAVGKKYTARGYEFEQSFANEHSAYRQCRKWITMLNKNGLAADWASFPNNPHHAPQEGNDKD